MIVAKQLLQPTTPITLLIIMQKLGVGYKAGREATRTLLQNNSGRIQINSTGQLPFDEISGSRSHGKMMIFFCRYFCCKAVHNSYRTISGRERFSISIPSRRNNTTLASSLQSNGMYFVDQIAQICTDLNSSFVPNNLKMAMLPPYPVL